MGTGRHFSPGQKPRVRGRALRPRAPTAPRPHRASESSLPPTHAASASTPLLTLRPLPGPAPTAPQPPNRRPMRRSAAPLLAALAMLCVSQVRAASTRRAFWVTAAFLPRRPQISNNRRPGFSPGPRRHRRARRPPSAAGLRRQRDPRWCVWWRGGEERERVGSPRDSRRKARPVTQCARPPRRHLSPAQATRANNKKIGASAGPTG